MLRLALLYTDRMVLNELVERSLRERVRLRGLLRLVQHLLKRRRQRVTLNQFVEQLAEKALSVRHCERWR